MNQEEDFGKRVQEQYIKYFGQEGWKPEFAEQMNDAFRRFQEED
jgi:hypothetical protein